MKVFTTHLNQDIVKLASVCKSFVITLSPLHFFPFLVAGEMKERKSFGINKMFCYNMYFFNMFTIQRSFSLGILLASHRWWRT